MTDSTGAPAFGQADLTNCDREVIHTPEAVQPHGALLVLDPAGLVVRRASANLAALVGATAEGLIGQPLGALLDERGVASVAAGAARNPPRPAHLGTLAAGPRAVPCEAALHEADGALVLELEPLPTDTPDPTPALLECLGAVRQTASVQALGELLVQQVRRLTGFDRVMLYRFLPDDSGAVVAEARREDMAPWLGLHYPATDIPQPARRLFALSPLRLLAARDAAPAPLLPAASGAPLDMSRCALRAVSPIHLQYLRNMGVGASMTLSVVRGGQLWGLIACHHDGPKYIPHALRLVCEAIGNLATVQIAAALHAEESDYRHVAANGIGDILALVTGAPHLAQGFVASRGALRDVVPSGGVAVWMDGAMVASCGTVPDPALLRDLIGWLDVRAVSGVFHTDRLGEVWPQAREAAATASGLLALTLPRFPADHILWFRPELVHDVTWAGDPSKAALPATGGTGLTPRASFAAWVETVRGRAQPWSEAELDAAGRLRALLLEVALRQLDEVARERLKAKEHQDLLMAELDHRVKNVLANVQALLRHTSGGARTLEAFVRDFERRVRAMAAAHSVLTASRWEGAALRALVQEELRPYLDQAGSRATVLGPDLLLRPKAALALSLALHELATNAAKYGALSGPRGRVTVTWRIVDETVVLEWTESEGPRVLPPTRRGFGSTVVERGLAYEVGGSTVLVFPPVGVRYTANIPLRHVVEAAAVQGRGAALMAAPGGMPLNGRRILVVEDSAIVAMEVEAVLELQGAEVVGPAASVAAALDLLRGGRLDAALLDVDLTGEMVFPVADALAEQGVPFLFTTGYEPSAVLPARHLGAPTLAKPYRGEDAATALAKLLATPRARADALA